VASLRVGCFFFLSGSVSFSGGRQAALFSGSRSCGAGGAGCMLSIPERWRCCSVEGGGAWGAGRQVTVAWRSVVRLSGGAVRAAATMGHMDVIPSVSVAASLFGYSAGHAFVPLAHILQETCTKLQSATDGVVLIVVTICRVDMPRGMLLFWSGYIDSIQQASASAETETAISVGVDSISSALRLLHVERRAHRAEAGRGGLGVNGASRGSLGGGGAERHDGGAATDDAAAGDGIVTAFGAGAVFGATPSGAAVRAAAMAGDAVGEKGPSFVAPPGVAPGATLSQSGAAGTGRLDGAADDGDAVKHTLVQQTPLDDDRSAASSQGGHTQAIGSQSTVSAAAASATGTGAASSRGGSNGLSGTSAGDKGTRNFFLSPDFVLPGLTVAPPRIVQATGRGRGRINPFPPPSTSP